MLPTLIAVALLRWVVLVTPGANVLTVSQPAASSQRRAACFPAYARSRKSHNRLASVLIGAFGLRILATTFAEFKGRDVG